MEVTRTGDGETRLNHIHAQQFELSCLKDSVEYLEEDNKELVEELNSIPLIEE